jgi:type VI protein secretion system component Hcp
MAAFMWIEGIPGRPGWDGWFEINSFDFGSRGNPSGASGQTAQFKTARVSKQVDSSSTAIMQRCARGDMGAASFWMSGENDVPLMQIDMTDAIITSCQTAGSDAEQFSLSFATAVSRMADNP